MTYIKLGMNVIFLDAVFLLGSIFTSRRRYYPEVQGGERALAYQLSVIFGETMIIFGMLHNHFWSLLPI